MAAGYGRRAGTGEPSLRYSTVVSHPAEFTVPAEG